MKRVNQQSNMSPFESGYGRNIEWWEDDGGFFGEYYILGDDSIDGFRPNNLETLEERTMREVDGIERLTGISGKHARIYDVACGYGRHSIQLALKKHLVIGFDINELHLSKARSDAGRIFQDHKYRPVFRKRNMIELNEEPIGIDVVINMFYSFGFFEHDGKNTLVMKNFYNVLKPGGQLVLQTDVAPEMLQGGAYKLSEERRLRDGGKLIIKEHYDAITHRMNGSWTVVDFRETPRPLTPDSRGNPRPLTPYSIRIYSAQEFIDLATYAGFSDAKVYGSFEGEKFTTQSSELILVAKK